jgi:ribosomal protein S18 acetylase RimI-like enzyme
LEGAVVVRIRPAATADAPAIAELAGQLGYPAEASVLAARLASLDDRSTVYVAESDGAVVGWIHCCERRTLGSDPQAEVLGLVVAEDQRGRGIGRALMARAEDWANERGFACVRLNSAVHRDGAHGFYSALGYTEIKRQAVFVKHLRV